MTEKKSRVFVVQEPIPSKDGKKVDISPALKFGEIHFLLPPADIVSAAPHISRVHKMLVDFSDDDYLLCIGDMLGMAMAIQVASQNNHGRVKYLKWFKREKDYYAVQIKSRLI